MYLPHDKSMRRRLLLQRAEADTPSASIDRHTLHDTAVRSERFLLCAVCALPITSKHHSAERSGAHLHEFTNPSGLRFRIGCFSEAPGVLHAGEPTLAYTWFPGYAWSYAVCRGCAAHLGWFYEKGDDRFFGLILDALREG